MATIRAFRAYRPQPQLAAKVAALPYDVMNAAEAKQMAEGNPYSFLWVDKAEIGLPADTDPYSPLVYQTARDNLRRMIDDGVYLRDEQPCFYLYSLSWQGHTQTGLVACVAVDDYLNDTVRKHELTRPDKEDDRFRHVDCCNAQTGPIFLAYRGRANIDRLTSLVMSREPLYDFSDGQVTQQVWRIDDEAEIKLLCYEFEQAGCLYIADGHHRAASAMRAAQKRRQQHPDYTGGEEFNYFLSVIFPDDQLNILDYNRVVSDLNGRSVVDFLAEVGEGFTVAPCSGPCRPAERHSFGLYLDHNWYLLTAKPELCHHPDPVRSLDVSILQEQILAPILGIDDPRRDQRISFVGGIRGLEALEELVNNNGGAAFALFPTSLSQLFAIADAGLLMPPKSTWFEPKLRSGLFIHSLED